MNVILLQTALLPHEMDLLLKEFPQYLFLSLSEAFYKNLNEEYWKHIEVIFGSRLTEEELSKARQLQWIHCPTSNMSRLCLKEIENKKSLIVSNTLEENIPQMGEFVMGAILAFAKNLFEWKEMQHFPSQLWDCKWRDSMTSLQNKIFLQIGLSRPGIEIARHARHFNMNIWGMDEKPSFHPYCHRTFGFDSIDDLLIKADIICVHHSRNKKSTYALQNKQLDRMKEDCILILLGSGGIVDEEHLANSVKSGKFRGVLVDANYRSPLAVNSPLWGLPKIIITPEVSPRPKSTERVAFRIFLYNLRQYVYGNYKDMRNVILSNLT